MHWLSLQNSDYAHLWTPAIPVSVVLALVRAYCDALARCGLVVTKFSSSQAPSDHGITIIIYIYIMKLSQDITRNCHHNVKLVISWSLRNQIFMADLADGYPQTKEDFLNSQTNWKKVPRLGRWSQAQARIIKSDCRRMAIQNLRRFGGIPNEASPF